MKETEPPKHILDQAEKAVEDYIIDDIKKLGEYFSLTRDGNALKKFDSWMEFLAAGRPELQQMRERYRQQFISGTPKEIAPVPREVQDTGEKPKQIRASEIIEGQFIDGACGPACLAHCCRRFGILIDQVHVADRMGLDPEYGASHKQMIECAKSLGLEATVASHYTLDQLQAEKKSGKEIIINFMSGGSEDDDGHYSVFEGATDDVVLLNDPSWYGAICLWRRNDFEACWYDITQKGERVAQWALILEPGEELSGRIA